MAPANRGPVRSVLRRQRPETTSPAPHAPSSSDSPPGTSLRHDGAAAPAQGTSGLAVKQCLELVVDACEAGGTDDVRGLKAAVEDLKTHYVEAVTAKPGNPPAGAVDAMLWNESALGRLLRRLAACGSDGDDAAMRFFATDSLVPRQFR